MNSRPGAADPCGKRDPLSLSRDKKPTPGTGPGVPLGILSGRPWRPHPGSGPDLVAGMRPEVPLDFQVSDYLLQVLAVRGVTAGRELER